MRAIFAQSCRIAGACQQPDSRGLSQVIDAMGLKISGRLACVVLRCLGGRDGCVRVTEVAACEAAARIHASRIGKPQSEFQTRW